MGGWQQQMRMWAAGPGVLVDAVPAPGGAAPGLSGDGIAGWTGGGISRCSLDVSFFIGRFPHFSDPLHVTECMVASSHPDIFSFTDISCSERRG